MSRHDDLHEGRRWLDTAREDLRAARMLRDAGMPAHACSLAQQCAEKAVKGVWYGAGEEPWGHSIQKLILEGRAWEGGSDTEMWRETAAALDRFYIPTRYPNGLPDLTPGQSYFDRDAAEALDKAAWVLQRCCGMLDEMDEALAAAAGSASEDEVE